jgi:hypothetical protein
MEGCSEVKTATLIRTLDSSIGSRLYSLSKPIRYAPQTAKRDGLTNYVVVCVSVEEGACVLPANWGGVVVSYTNLAYGMNGNHENVLKQLGYILVSAGEIGEK